MPYIGKTPSQATRARYYLTASGSETSISGSMTTGGTLTFTDGNFVDVSVNGVALVAGTDYNTNTANTIAGLTALTANDQVEIIVYDTFSVFSGDVDSDFSVGGNLSVTGTTALTGVVTANAGVVVDNITIDGTEIDLSSGDLTIDVAGDITLDADGGDIILKDGGTQFGQLYKNGNDFRVESNVSDGDLVFTGNDGGTGVTALTLDMSDAGKAIFNAGAAFSGDVGISTSSPVANLEIEDGGTSNSILTKITADDQNPYALMIGNDSYSATDTNAFGFLQRDDGTAYIYNGGALRAAFHNVNSGVLSLEGGVVLGAGAANSTTANTLDDYEEGTFTPAWSGGYGSAPSYGDQLGTYTKIGRLVQVQIRINVSSGSRGGAALTLANLPFTSRSANPSGGGFTVYQNNFHSTADYYPRVDQNSTTMRFYEENGSAVNANELDADSYEIEMVMIYESA